MKVQICTGKETIENPAENEIGSNGKHIMLVFDVNFFERIIYLFLNGENLLRKYVKTM